MKSHLHPVCWSLSTVSNVRVVWSVTLNVGSGSKRAFASLSSFAASLASFLRLNNIQMNTPSTPSIIRKLSKVKNIISPIFSDPNTIFSAIIKKMIAARPKTKTMVIKNRRFSGFIPDELVMLSPFAPLNLAPQ